MMSGGRPVMDVASALSSLAIAIPPVLISRMLFFGAGVSVTGGMSIPPPSVGYGVLLETSTVRLSTIVNTRFPAFQAAST
ncbi:Uncharacterised protein [Bordetella pertussis]|nr:Uncharacterised protein [Bordetella pertussis]